MEYVFITGTEDPEDDEVFLEFSVEIGGPTVDFPCV